MTAAIDVRCARAGDAWACRVTIAEGPSSSSHKVRVTAADLARLAPGAPDPTDLVERSFRFLLAREPKESILARFDLPVIGRYFPEYEREVAGGR